MLMYPTIIVSCDGADCYYEEKLELDQINYDSFEITDDFLESKGWQIIDKECGFIEHLCPDCSKKVD